MIFTFILCYNITCIKHIYTIIDIHVLEFNFKHRFGHEQFHLFSLNKTDYCKNIVYVVLLYNFLPLGSICTSYKFEEKLPYVYNIYLLLLLT